MADRWLSIVVSGDKVIAVDADFVLSARAGFSTVPVQEIQMMINLGYVIKPRHICARRKELPTLNDRGPSGTHKVSL
jgi:hypothetical protein